MESLVMDSKELKEEARRALDSLPVFLRRRLENLAIVVERRPAPGLLLELGLDPRRDSLYGLYQGTPLFERSSVDPPLYPDKITLFAEPLQRDFPEPEALKEQIRTTVLHEIAHYFGMEEDQIEELGY